MIDEMKKEVPMADSLIVLIEKYEVQLLQIDADSENDLLLFKAQANRLEKDLLRGIIANSDATTSRNRLNYSLMQILDNFARSAKG